MAPPDNLHSRVVVWLKVILPLSALALLSTLFLVARQGDPNVTLPYSERELEEMAREQQVRGPDFSGTTADGRAITVTAETAAPRDGELTIVDAKNLRGTLETGDGGSIDIAADAGTVHTKDSRVDMQGNVRIVTSTGYTITTEEMTAALDETRMETLGPVSAEGPLGRIDAGRAVVTGSERAPGDVSVVFKNGVKLIYMPRNQQGATP